MKFRLKNISKLLVAGILFNSFNLSSYASVLSEDGRYETFDNSDITINDVLEEDKVDMKIEGSTLVNLARNITSRGVVSDAWGIWGHIKISPEMLKEGKIYTVILENLPKGFQWVVTNRGQTIYYTSEYTTTNISLMSSATSYEELVIHVNDGGVSNITQEQVDKINVTILEGDWTNREIPDYFKGIQSSFENNLVTQDMVDNGEEKQENLGKYKAEVKMANKNLWNFSSKEFTPATIDWFDVQGNPNMYLDMANKTKNKLYLSEGWYKFDYDRESSKNVSILQMVEINESFITGSTNRAFYLPSGYYTIRVRNQEVNQPTYVSKVIIKETTENNSEPIEYEPYKESTNTFYLNSPLLEGDTIEYINGQATHVKRYKKLLLDGSEDEGWLQGYTNTNTIQFVIPIDIAGNVDAETMSDKFNYVNAGRYEEDVEMVHVNGSTLKICIGILKSKLSTGDIEGFKQWLKTNPTTVVYPLLTPIYEPIKADLSVQLFEGTTHIINNSNIPANMEITVDRTISRAVEAIKLAKTSPTVENLALARMWTNLVRESAKKDELQGEIDDITDIEDLELERKSVTANMDLYVRSENALSMSLDTNSVTFEGYSGVSDMEKLGAVNISINSSLPYSLNAYMPVELSNSDGTNKMPANLLNIRENGISEYKRFANTNDKVVLNDSCEAGNDIMHKIDLKLSSTDAHKSDVYKAVIKFEAEQK